MPVKHLAVDPIAAEPTTPLRDVARTMNDEGVGDLVVVDDDEPVGIVTDRDVALAFGRGEDLEGMTAGDLMTEDPVTIRGDAEAVELPRRMAEGNVRRMPVVDDDGEVIGIATLDDVVATVGEELENVATVIEAQSPEYVP